MEILTINTCELSKNMYASILKKLGSHGDHRGVLSVCQDEKIDYLSEQVSLVTTVLPG